MPNSGLLSLSAGLELSWLECSPPASIAARLSAAPLWALRGRQASLSACLPGSERGRVGVVLVPGTGEDEAVTSNELCSVRITTNSVGN